LEPVSLLAANRYDGFCRRPLTKIRSKHIVAPDFNLMPGKGVAELLRGFNRLLNEIF